ncbi:MAG: amidohydrolase family protein [Bacteroidetes bacterium]|nr:amidohydrolase family protein [Bacteroidota bacterium]
MKNIFILLILTFSTPLTFGQKITSKQTHQQIPVVIKNVNIITLDSTNTIINNATVVIVGNRIDAINSEIPQKATVIDGKGKWLIPGLIDMHVHIPTDGGPFGPKMPTQGATMFFDLQDYMTLYNANGVTTIFDLGSKPEHFGQRNEIGKGNVIGPRMALAAVIDGGEGQGRRANTTEDGRQAVRSAKAEGYEFIKVYSDLNIETYNAIIDEANKQGLKTIGHIPDAFQGKLKDVFVPHFGMIAHAEELTKHAIHFNEAEAKEMAEMLKKNDTWLCPTLITIEWILKQVKSLDATKALPTLKYIHPLTQSKWLTANKYNQWSDSATIIKFENYVKFNNYLVKACKEIGVPIVAGTDAGTSSVVPGFTMHDELELYVAAGLTPQEALASATRLSANWLGIESIVGSIEINKLADLVLLEANPLDNINNTRKIAGVFINGRWIGKKKINITLSELAKWNTANKDKYNWKALMNKRK